MKKKNGFAIAGVLYPLLVLFLMFVFLILGSLMSTNIQYKKVTSDIQAKINGESKITLPYYEAPSPTDTHLGIIYLDPTDLNKTCTKAEAESNLQGKDKNGTTTLTGTKTGCMKWYIFKRTGDTLSLILDHNTTARSIYDFQSKNSYSNGKVDDPYEVWWELNELVTTSGWKVTPRLITGQEIADISGNTNFNASTHWFYLGSNTDTTSTGRTAYFWLYDYLWHSTSYGGTNHQNNEYLHLNNLGEEVSRNDAEKGDYPYGYWVNDIYETSVRFIFYDGRLSVTSSDNSRMGIRPVIEITAKGTGVDIDYAKSGDLLSRIKSSVSSGTQNGVYFFNNDGILDYGQNGIEISYKNLDTEVKGNISVWNGQVIYACFNYGNNNYEYDLIKKGIQKREMPCLTNRYQNLVINGDLSSGTNYNLTLFGSYTNGYLTKTTSSRIESIYATDYIPVDVNKTYEMGIDIKASNTSARYYVGVLEYDTNKKDIIASKVMYMANTLTELTEDLKPGDTVVHLKDLTNWNVDTGTRTYQRGLIFWNYVDRAGYLYPEQTLSQNSFLNLYNSDTNDVDKAAKTITLKSAWPQDRGTIPAGTKVSQTNDGSTRNYGILVNNTVTTAWATHQNTMRGEGVTDVKRFRYGTKFVRMFIFMNYNNVADTVTDMKNFYIREVASEDGKVLVDFNPNGGTVSASPKQLTVGGTYGTLPTPTRGAYIFKGWHGKNLLNLEAKQSLPSRTAFSNETKRTFEVGTMVLDLAYNNYYSPPKVTSLTTSYNSITFTTSSGYGVGYPLLSSPGKRYTLSYEAHTTSDTLRSSVMFYKQDGTLINTIRTDGSGNKEVSFTTPAETYYLVIDFCAEGTNTKATFQNVQLEEGTQATTYEPYYIQSNTIVNQKANHTLKAIWDDPEAPTLALSKETYVDVPFNNSWTLTNASVDGSGVLTIGANGNDGSALSSYIDVNGEFWYMTFDGYTETASPNHGTSGGALWTGRYYDTNHNAVRNDNGDTSNGFAVAFPLNAWKNDIYWMNLTTWKGYKRYGQNVKYLTLEFKTGNNYSKSPVKLRNLKVYGQMQNSFYLINVSSSDNIGVITTKYAKGNHTKEYFKNNGTIVVNNQARVEENGTYTVYVEDNAGNSTIQTIEITNIR